MVRRDPRRLRIQGKIDRCRLSSSLDSKIRVKSRKPKEMHRHTASEPKTCVEVANDVFAVLGIVFLDMDPSEQAKKSW